jgi:hypothetical protein
VAPFDSKQFEIRREDVAIATWVGPKDDVTLAKLIELFRLEKWRGNFVISFSQGGVNGVVFTEKKLRRIADEQES